MKKTANLSIQVITDILCDACGASVVLDFQKLTQPMPQNDFRY
jgi:hypothetical protein